MGNTTLLFLLLVFAFVGMGTTGCSKTGSTDSNSPATIQEAVSLPSKGNFRLSLTDAPHPSLSHVYVNVDHVELLLQKGGDAGRFIMGQNMGTIDLLKLRDGVHMPIQDLNLQEAVIVKEFRLILKETGNSIVRLEDGSTCELKTPSQQQTGLKLKMPNGGIQIEAGQVYSLIVDFDVDHSIVDNKHTCLLKPVLKVKTLLQVPANPDDGEETPDDGSTDGGETPDDGSTDGGTDGSTDGNTDGGTDGSTDGNTDGGETPDDGSGDGTTTPGDGSTDGGDNGGSGTDVDPGDGAPIVVEGDPRYFY